MARPETLIPGNCYFSVGFYDNDLVLPMIDTLVYVGQETDQQESIVHLCRRVLAEVYSMRRGDVLEYHPLKKADIPPHR